MGLQGRGASGPSSPYVPAPSSTLKPLPVNGLGGKGRPGHQTRPHSTYSSQVIPRIFSDFYSYSNFLAFCSNSILALYTVDIN